MPDQDRGSSLRRSLQYFQENVRRAGPAASAGYALLGALILLGGIGYAVDAWADTEPWGLLAGLILGIVVGFYELARVVWPR